MKCVTLFVFCLICGTSLFGQSTSTPEQKQEPPSGTPGSERLFRVCDPKNPIAPCATAPRPVFTPDPEYSEEARKAHIQGMCVLWLAIGSDGKPRSVRVARGLGYGLCEKAVDAVKQWKFKPALMDGQPVAVQINIELGLWLDGVVVSPKTAQLVTGSQQHFALVSTPPVSAVHWSVSGLGCVASACGSISPDGLYTAPLTVPNPATVIVTATSATDPTKNGWARVTIVPSPSQVITGSQQQFSIAQDAQQSVPPAQSFVPAAGQTFYLDLDTAEAAFSQWRHDDLGSLSALRATLNVPRLRSNEQWNPVFSVWLQNTEAGQLRNGVGLQLLAPGGRLPLTIGVKVRVGEKTSMESSSKTIGLNENLTVEMVWQTPHTITIKIGDSETHTINIPWSVDSVSVTASTGELKVDPLVLGSVGK